MTTRYRGVINVLLRIVDALVVAAAWLLAYSARLASPFGNRDFPKFNTYASLVPLIMLLWGGIFSMLGVYRSGRMRGRKAEVLRVWRAHCVALLLFMSLAYFFDNYKYSRLVLIYFGFISAVALAACRVTLRTVMRALRKRGHDVRRVVIVGSGHPVQTLVERFQTDPELGMSVLGLVTSDGEAAPSLPEAQVLGQFSDLDAIVEAQQPNEVLVALSAHEQTHLNEVLAQLRDVTASVRIIPDVYSHAILGCQAEHFEGMAMISFNDTPMDSGQSVAKRSMDAVLSLAGLVILSPLLLLIAVLVKLTSPGPILYAQERMGLDGRTFPMLKFRSMRADAEAPNTVGWTRPNDDRRTALGIILRKTSLDELPQLWNVLVGHMSLVGPRPERPVFVRQFRREIPAYMLRHKVKAGITGWAQVNGWRGDTSLTERTACDLYYIRNWSLDLDVRILFLTLWKGFVSKNAY